MPDTVQTLRDNLEEVQSKIKTATDRAGRSSDSVQLIAVCKYVDAATTALIVNAGCNAVGESRPQVLWDKHETLGDTDVQWHMIGHLQRNKVKRTLAAADWVHSIDSERLLRAVIDAATESQKPVDCLLEVNISGESAKHGLDESELESILAIVDQESPVSIRGLMGMASLSGSAADNQREFSELREIRDRIQSKVGDAFQLTELSMGMSGDFEAAIAEGSTMIRVGSMLFKGIE